MEGLTGQTVVNLNRENNVSTILQSRVGSGYNDGGTPSQKCAKV